jgi:hypothetical protein
VDFIIKESSNLERAKERNNFFLEFPESRFTTGAVWGR